MACPPDYRCCAIGNSCAPQKPKIGPNPCRSCRRLRSFDLAFQKTTSKDRSLRQLLQWIGVLIVPTLRVVTPPVTLCVTVDAERPWLHSFAARGNDQIAG
ncbi:hypothetical protein EJA71_09060 [Pseudomonas sp. PB106]|nr:hypothetical protein EJA71_09060 [Pseudomonas sp. PB106]